LLNDLKWFYSRFSFIVNIAHARVNSTLGGFQALVKVSIIILNYNGLKFIDCCLTSVLGSNYSDFEVIFVDNASSDGSIAYFKEKFGSHPNFKLVINDKNYGFALGNNIGARQAIGKYLVFLNIDTIVDPSWLTELVSIMDSYPLVGAAQCKLLLMDNPKFIDSAGHDMDWFGIAYVRGHKAEDHGQYDKITEIFGATGAALIMRKDIFKNLGGFDKDFFMLFEEDDLCWRTWIAGYKVLFIPKAKVFHKSGALRSIKGNYTNLFLSRRNRIISLIKNYSTKNLIRFLPLNLLLLFGVTFFTVDKVEYFKAYIDSMVWIIHNSREISLKRQLTQAMRKVPDEHLIRMGILRKPAIRKMIKSGY
jgi:GT2 family glycosyltransferase